MQPKLNPRHPHSASQMGLDHIVGLLVTLVILLFFALPLHAGGPRWVAGSSYFSPSVKGHPVVWSNGKVSYFTDLGNLSSAVTQAQANTMVANAAAVWNNVSTAAVSIQAGGSLAEDVSGASVTVAGNGSVTLPADIQPTATSKPVAVVYDQDGSVINAIYGAGASSTLACENNGVIATVDRFTTDGNIAHALILVNGLCTTTTDEIANVQYQLIRAFGLVLGLGWSQTNEEMFVGDQITTDGLTGWPIMHPIERLCNGGGGLCMLTDNLRTDDIASLNRLYPVTAANIGSFPGKTLTAAATISISGTIQFSRGQGMQGVNVVLQPLVNGVPDLRYTATAVSGVYFEGNAGNPVTGTADAQGNPLNRFGSDDPSLEGFFDLSDVPLPPGTTASDYQLSFEPVNPLYIGNSSVGPYSTSQVTPSGTLPVLTLSGLTAGSTVSQNVLIQDSAEEAQSGPDGSQAAPATVPLSGEWTGRITGYGHSGFFEFYARGDREFTVEAQALDETGAPTQNKAQMVLGVWSGSDPVGSSAVTSTIQSFNGVLSGLTTLPVLTVADGEVRIGLADLRGDGRPDFAYHGRILYIDSVTPARLSASGGQIVLEGMGFRPGMTVSVNDEPAQVTSIAPNTIVAVAPPAAGVTGDVVVQIQDPQTLGIAAIGGSLSYDAQGDDAISVILAPSGSEPIGIPEPLTIRAINVTSQTPAAGVTVTFSVTQGTASLGCGQNFCTAVTGGDGTATTEVTANSSSLAQIASSLTNGSTVLAQFTGTAPALIAAVTPGLYVAEGATVQWPVQALVVDSSGTPAAHQSVTWFSGTGASVSLGQSASASAGIAANTIAAAPMGSSASTAKACLTATTYCTSFTVVPVQPSTEAIIPWAGTVQFISAGQAFSPVVLHVIDAFGDPTAGARVTIVQAFYGWTEPCPTESRCSAAPLLAEQSTQATSGVDGSVAISPLSGENLPGRLLIIATAGTSATFNFELDAHP